MSELEMSKTSLPSIKFLLQENTDTSSDDITISARKRKYGHKVSRSVSSLPLDLQSLSLQGPEDMKIEKSEHQSFNNLPLVSTTVEKSPNWMLPSDDKPPSWMLPSDDKPPSWMLPNDKPALPTFHNNYSVTDHKRKARSVNGHHRSVSELPSLPSFNSISPLTAPITETTQLPFTSPLPSSNINRTHRRAASANTLDFMLSNSTVLDRAQSYSPKEKYIPSHISASDPILKKDQADRLNEAVNHSSHSNVTSSGEGRYSCPYCQKKFSRPSSLRIHTYSHTGEKPFVCSEPGCGRHFSVQSNMRRHLRVHRLGRSVNNNPLGTTNEENENHY